MLYRLCPLVKSFHSRELAGRLFKILLGEPGALDGLDDITAVVGLVDEEHYVLFLHVKIRVELIADLAVKEVVIVQDDHVCILGGVHHQLYGQMSPGNPPSSCGRIGSARTRSAFERTAADGTILMPPLSPGTNCRLAIK